VFDPLKVCNSEIRVKGIRAYKEINEYIYYKTFKAFS
jgi:hypothetical protein